MRIALIADTFPPLRTSGAVQLRDLSREFVRQGLLYLRNIVDSLLRWIVMRNIREVLILFDVLLYLLRKLHIGSVAGAAGNNVSFNRMTY